MAQTPVGTPLTFSFTSGALNINVPAGVTLDNSANSLKYGNPTSAPTMAIEIIDDRGGVLVSYTLSVKMTNFVNGSASVAASNVTYTSQAGIADSSPYDLLHLYAPAVIPGNTLTLSNVSTNVASSSALTGKTATIVKASVSTPVSNFTVAGTYSAVLTHTVV
ncbi:MAG: hypothetical protein LLG14_25410 [Nocardiaceae bacterium]|nr:hypothetical protein [Nocardiaceae bacterium]